MPTLSDTVQTGCVGASLQTAGHVPGQWYLSSIAWIQVTAQWLATAWCGYVLTDTGDAKLSHGFHQVCVQFNWESAEGGEEAVAGVAVLRKTLKGPLLSGRGQKNSQVSTCCGSPYRARAPVSLTMKWCWLLAARGRTWPIQGTVALRCQSEGCFEPRVYIPVYSSMIVSTVCLF